MEAIRIIYQNLGIKNLVTNSKASCKKLAFNLFFVIMFYFGCRFQYGCILWHLSFVKFQNKNRKEYFQVQVLKNSEDIIFTILIRTFISSLKTRKSLIKQGFPIKNKHRFYDTLSYHNYGAFLAITYEIATRLSH